MSPDSWTGLATAALRLGISNEALVEAGLVKQRQDGSPYDAFRNRVMFPIVDASGGGGRVIAFGGRVLVEKRDEAGNVVEAKYLNSPDTRLFNKSESLYGLNHARQQIIRTRTAVIVEGYMDAIACHQAGVTNVVATLGTALTPEHARILRNYAQTVVLVFDSDDAGRRAADRALEVFVRGSLDIKLTNVPDGKDPCDFCMKNGGEPFLKLVEAADDALAYKWKQLQGQFHGTNSVTARQEAVTTYLRFVGAALEGDGGPGAVPHVDPVRRGLLLTRVAGLVNMPAGGMEEVLKKRFTAEDLRLVLIDPKMVEMQHYNALPHLIVPVVTEAKKVPLALGWVIREMEKRFQIFAKSGVRNIAAFNARPKKSVKPETETPLDPLVVEDAANEKEEGDGEAEGGAGTSQDRSAP